MMKHLKKVLTKKQSDDLLHILQKRFNENMKRHPKLSWDVVSKKLAADIEVLWSVSRMEETGGEPDVVVLSSSKNTITMCDCSAESPIGRRSLCFDATALAKRKENKPVGSAGALADAMGVQMLTEEEYMTLQTFGTFDLKTSSWLATPVDIRDKGGAIFADFRYGRVFIYHNGAESYYSGRGFRGRISF